MLSFLNTVKEFDALLFLPDEDENTVRFEVCTYKDAGEPVGGSGMGLEYHIVLFKVKDGNAYEFDSYDAILVEPRTYIAMLIPQDFYGLVARKTTTSINLVNTMKETIDNTDFS